MLQVDYNAIKTKHDAFTKIFSYKQSDSVNEFHLFCDDCLLKNCMVYHCRISGDKRVHISDVFGMYIIVIICWSTFVVNSSSGITLILALKLPYFRILRNQLCFTAYLFSAQLFLCIYANRSSERLRV